MQVIRLLHQCNNRCRFCLVSNEIHSSNKWPDPNSILEQIKSYRKPEIIDFFGGEPTLYPDILEVVTKATEMGHTCTLASNCRKLNNVMFVHQFREAGIKFIRSSLLAADAELHNSLCQGGNTAFQETTDGFQNVLDAGIDLQVNTVILRQNYKHLESIARFLKQLKVVNIKLGSLAACNNYNELAIEHHVAFPYISTTIDFALENQMNICIEKTPRCVLGKYHMYSLQEKMRQTSYIMCATCSSNERCYGFDEKYLALFMSDCISEPNHL